MRKKFLLAVGGLMMTALTSIGAYDVKSKALVPVEFKKAPDHETVPLVKDGKLQFVIAADLQAEDRMIGKNRTQKSIAPAIAIVQDAFEKCTGVKPEVVDIKNAGKYPMLIVIGDCSVARENGVDVSKLPSQGLMVKTFPKGIILAGNDSSLIEGYNSKRLEDRGSSTGSKYAAIDFTERFLGIRYYFPGEYGTIWPKTSELSIAPICYTDYPRFDTRYADYYLGSVGNFFRTEKNRRFWEPYLGPLTRKDQEFYTLWRTGRTLPGGGGHSPDARHISKAYPDKLKTIFYTSPSGHFWYNSKFEVGNYFDVLNLEFADLLLSSMKKYYDSNGKVNEGGFGGLNLSYVSFGMCDTLLPDADVINHPLVKELNLMTPADIARGENAGMANIYARFHQYLANGIKREFPGKKLYIMAYYNVKYSSLDPRWTLPENTEVKLCLGDIPTKTRNKNAIAKNVQIMKEWYEALGNRTVNRLWVYDVGSNPFVKFVSGEFVGDIPKIFGKYLGREELFYDHNSLGPGDYWFYYTSAYSVYHSMWNPDWDVDAAIDEHWEPFYGKEAGQKLREFHKLVKDCYLKYSVPLDEKVTLYPMTDIEKMEQLLAQAKKAIRPGTVEEQRFKLISAPWPDAFQTMRNQISYERPVYTVYQMSGGEKVVVDGKRNEAFWEKVKPMSFIDPKGSAEKPKYPVVVKLAWDKTGLYGLLETTYAPKAEKQHDLWENDNYELIFSPGMKSEVEYQFVFDALNQIFLGSQRHLPIPQAFNYSWKAPGFQVASVNESAKWTAEFYIPFSVFDAAIPKPNEMWLCNVVRNKNGSPKETSGISMTLGNNHNMSMFGIIRFAGKGE